MGMEVWLYSHGSNGEFTIDTIQRCYTLKSLWNDRAVRSTWKKLPKQSAIVFYKDARCSGDSITSRNTPSGSYSFEDSGKLNKEVSSFMVYTTSEDPSMGKVEITADDPGSLFDKAELNGTTGSQ
ncbi:hypothetical protein PF005_g15220 [Phytophthora fragariae]|uniref:Uncharacterized protein n=2 Tax=Phytophthora TaxID=4783 RepID=A0A6A3JNX2_9STRA|nr:hypothetical protein PF003_g38279 [Phytophthora fragariae]KAE8979386.1 hypothetical protein PR002_g24433 [Phytophthora rubi]KAE8933706.1 hypothetical protein PF009_g16300 [Phytophthora fragariae]KAE8981204.1 hypothetical protein PR001_g24066 [Phytophthora rubi]KAE8996966.1 hypothetical protein PF011_g15691 [Phytophthora fragariae]